MRAKPHLPCEIFIYSKCFWKPFLLAVTFTAVFLSLYTFLTSFEYAAIKNRNDVIIFDDQVQQQQQRGGNHRPRVHRPHFNAAVSNENQQYYEPPPLITKAPEVKAPLTKKPAKVESSPEPFTHEPVRTEQPEHHVLVHTEEPAHHLIGSKVPKLKLTAPVFNYCPLDNSEDDVTPWVDCRKLFSGEEHAVEHYKDWHPPCDVSDHQIEMYAENCTLFHEVFPMEFDFTFDQAYADFPLAYVLVVEKNADQVVRLLQSLYRPQNLYCVTYDAHSRDDFKRAMNNIASCYSNIIMPREHIDINWGGFSILQANMECLRIMNDHPNKWRYVQMLSWNDYPLKTNEEMVDIFKILNGSNDSELKDGEPYRYVKYFVEDHVDTKKESISKPVPPGGLYIFKGSLATSLTREFVDFVFHDEIPLEYYNYSKSMLIPEEQYWATLIHNLHIHPPGGFPGICKHYFWYRQKRKKPWISRYQMWKELKDPCEGQWTHKSCVFGVGDLWSLKSRPELVAHKIYADFQPATAFCLAELHYNRTYVGRTDDDKLDMKYFHNLPAVKYQNMNDKSKFNCVG